VARVGSSRLLALVFRTCSYFRSNRIFSKDRYRNVFMANPDNGTRSEFLGLAKPVIAPVQNCVVC
jgi:hypothetical protein